MIQLGLFHKMIVFLLNARR